MTSMGYGMAADGLRARYAPASNGLYYLFQWDPQGSLVQRQTGGSGGNTSYYALDTVLYDGYGAKLGDTDAFTGNPEGPRDSMGFQGQFGAYTDNETGLVLMGHRYYDAGTGRFLTRDPKGYGGGINLYGFTGNNPVNESDPDGFQPGDGYISGNYRDLRAKARKARAGDRGSIGELAVSKYYRGLGKQVRFNPEGSNPTGDLSIDGVTYEVKSFEAGTSKNNALSRIIRSSQAKNYIVDVRGSGLGVRDFANANVLLRQSGKSGIGKVIALGDRELGPLRILGKARGAGKFLGPLGVISTGSSVVDELRHHDPLSALDSSGVLDDVAPLYSIALQYIQTRRGK